MDNEGEGILVRQARPEDAVTIVELEKRVWSPLGTDVYGMEHIEAWLETHPEGLTVAESGGRIVGYQYSQIVDFEFEHVMRFSDFDAVTDRGLTRRTHHPDGNAVHCISLLSTAKGSGRLLLQGVLDSGDESGRPFTVFMSRMSGFGRFMDMIADGKMIPAGIDEATIADWYAIRCSRALGSTPWPMMRDVPDLNLPEPASDPVLSKQLRFRRMRLVATFPACMKDPESRGFAALLIGINRAKA